MRRIRLERQLTQEQLGELIGVSYQQVQKYETGANRVAAGKLWLIARVLDCGLLEFMPDDSFEPAREERPDGHSKGHLGL
ncbi:hypothetical protein GCM10011390_34920 [Aureimonas endophytica]|uniref:HTH cro/C1-type domain-containing protein n=1 Tax=Aureimonas endophytica TaxID=2027858 RepID=A0A917E9L5_9HYPH|nr:hypothetical protein GCM10011390_34920 [Aureimonas endophytica]